MLSPLLLTGTLLCIIQSSSTFHVSLSDDGLILASLERSDLQDNVTAYAAQVSGEARLIVAEFRNTSELLVFNTSFHGLCYSVSLLLKVGQSWSRPEKTMSVLTKPLPVHSVQISDFKESPETGVVFEIEPPAGNVFSRVNISYTEAQERRSFLYKDFYKGKTVFKHWLPGVCYRNITFQLISEATVNQTALVSHSDITHSPLHHRTVPYPPLNISRKIVPLSPRAGPGGAASRLRPEGNQESTQSSRRARDVPLMEEQEENTSEEAAAVFTQVPFIPPQNQSGTAAAAALNQTTETQSYWLDPTEPPATDTEDEFVNAVVSEYEDSNEPGSAMGLPSDPPVLPTKLPPLLLELRWLPPRPPTSYDGFNVYIYRDGNSTETATVDENTHEFFTELTESGTYRVQVTTLSSAGDCEARESAADTSFSFYLSPGGELLEELRERPRAVSVRLLDSSTAAVSWASSPEDHNGSVVSVASTTCLKPSPSQRMENTYCGEENTTSDIITNLTPGAQYRVTVFHTNGPLISPPSEPVIIDIEPTGVRELAIYPLSPTAVILSWQRPYHVSFRKYVLQTFFFNPVTLASEWTTYYEIAATASIIASVRVTDLLPAWYYNFRVSMVTWGDPALSCCDSSTVSFVTAPEAPHVSSVDYSHGVLYIRWTYGELFIDLSHSRMLHWQVVAVGKKGGERSYSVDVTRNVMRASLPLPPGDIYNLTVTACTERSRNTSTPNIIKLEPAPPTSLFAVNATHSSVTLLWSEEGVVDYYQVVCRARGGRELKAREPQTVSSHLVTVSGLTPSSSYNCTIVSFSYSTPSKPAHITITTVAKEMNPSVAAISALAVLSILLASLLVLFLLVLRKKHLQMTRECGAETFVNFASFERDGKLPYNWRRSLFAFLTLLPSCLWTDYLLAFYINPWSKTALKKRKLTSPVQLDDFDAYFKEMSKDSAYKFSLQFEELKSVGLDLSHDAADLPVNRPKNRYTNILPYDFSRVQLISMHNDEGSDYINANYIPGYKHAKEYIATQGPLPETRNDFWRMVLQEKSPIVVMLTQCNERRRVKCDHYWPFTDEPVMYGEISVEMLSEAESLEWTIRKFRLGYADESQDVLHLNYTSWPDHGVPTVNAIESILQFVHIVRQQANRTKDPIIVHCSAGVGRTGTFMALDRLMQHIREHEFADILGLVSEMRSHRLSMVQTEEQYVFIHQCVLLMWQKKKQLSITSDVIYENASKT
ncbi:receptor-type tyrosine-protein phosphatase O isoform X1 [Hippoglossus hippoglossus]|uniref:receptor-type tyrosine-protein phosphatase O isoform X1 n=2 Tax=Hippoglossus hippoglossus TaxID=8267 RepID=UPI00148DE8AF|nr:receptor-type tyrosine-protein phosphatase O isoform X1 [Hippoglossus hippoglossus]XP_034434761.1 receptor-type tyrosine-protein phosphatase O isoform X1 [Hippoglossus hippoglossus]XP_034434762.1 receptor-type tyrosine-protein phosphatase O isoform X1 [Hippoglossus hippoglossus]XP_034434764.1 receptor-type tyrosine-protein phosphatase O isoform X1 [Hippoglossus hippoglossus]